MSVPTPIFTEHFPGSARLNNEVRGELAVATCKTCGRTIAVPEGWSVGPAVRKHYWEQHPERMEKTRADRSAEATLPSPEGLPRGSARKVPKQGPKPALKARPFRLGP